jgi:hypothetical protein
MLISASRRTDIAAFYAPWLMQRLREGYCSVPNPFNARQVQRISLVPEEVEAIIFWTRHPRPLFPYLEEMDARGYRYYFQYTLLDYPPSLDQENPPVKVKIAAFQELANKIGPERVIWRYDPIVLSSATPEDFHLQAFSRLAAALEGSTQHVVVSLLTPYNKIQRRMLALEKQGVTLLPPAADGDPRLGDFLRSLSEIALSRGMQITSCASEQDFSSFGILPGKCVDDELIQRLFGIDVSHTKDPGQRKACGCMVSKDIGMYDTCLYGCQYCYATTSFARARSNHARHKPSSPSLIC